MMMRNQSAHTNPLLVGREFSPEHKSYLAAREVSLDVAKSAGLVSVSRKEAEELLGFAYPSKEGGLWIPYPGADDFGRLRLDETFPSKKGKATRFLTPKEEVRPYLSLLVSSEIWQDTTQPLYIVEGPIKALALIGVGLTAIGLAGVRTGHQKGASVSRLHDEIIEKVKLLNRRVVVLFDAGRANNKEVLSAEKKQAELYAAAGARVFVAALPLTAEGNDQGPDDYLARFGVEKLRVVIDAAKLLEEAYPNEEKAATKKTQAQIVVELMKETGAPIWMDNQGAFWITFETGGHLEHHPLRSEAARRYMRQLTHDKAGVIPGTQAVQDAIATLEAITPQGAPQPVFVRVGELQGRVYLDLGNADWNAVEIDCEGWRVVKVPPVRFRRAKGMLALPIPVQGGELRELRRFVNTPQETEWRFVASWLLAALRAKGPYPICVMQGEQGCAKSTTSKMLRSLVDPNACALRTAPRKEQDLAIAASNGWVVAYDNLSGVHGWLSDALCRASTGGGFATRALYSDSEETLLEFQRPVLLNGIDEVATRGDLADRALLVTLPRIDEENRREESEVWEEFEEARPRLLGALLSVVSAGLKKLPSIKAKRLPRMADFAKWILACEEALGWEAGSFLEAYSRSKNQMAESLVEGDLFARSLVEFIREKAEWRGSAGELLALMNKRVDEYERRVKGWPQDATRASNKLRRVAPSLVRLGLQIRLDIREGKEGRRAVYLGKADAADAVPPAFQLESFEREKEEREEHSSVRTELQNSVSSVRASAPQMEQGVAADAGLTLTLENPHSVSLASAGKAALPKVADAVYAADAEKQPRSKLTPNDENLNALNEQERGWFEGERAARLDEGASPEQAERDAMEAVLLNRRLSSAP